NEPQLISDRLRRHGSSGGLREDVRHVGGPGRSGDRSALVDPVVEVEGRVERQLEWQLEAGRVGGQLLNLEQRIVREVAQVVEWQRRVRQHVQATGLERRRERELELLDRPELALP